MRAVQFDHHGDVEVLQIRDIPRPVPGVGEVVVDVEAAGINPGEASIRQGLLEHLFPTTLPSGQGSDLAGVVVEVGPGVDSFDVGDEVLGFVDNRSSQAEFVLVPANQLTIRPESVPWDVAGGLFVAGTTAYAAVRAVQLSAGDTVAVAGAAGGVGSIAVQLARHVGATVLGIAGPSNDEWLRKHGVIPVNYGDGLGSRLLDAAPAHRIDAFLDFFGAGYVEVAATELGIAPQRINTIIDFPAVEQFGVTAVGNAAAATAEVLAELAALVSDGELEVAIAASFPLSEVREAYRLLEQRHTRGKIVLHP